MARFVPVLLLALLSWLQPGGAFAASHTQDSDATVKSNLASGAAVLADVREPGEWAAGHLQTAVSVPLSELKLNRGYATLPRDKIVYLHCASGRRVLPSADILAGVGFTDVRALPWGFDEMLRRGFPAAK